VSEEAGEVAREVWTSKGRVVAAEAVAGGEVAEIDLDGRVLREGFVNGHDHLDFSTFPPLGNPPYANVYDWARDVDGGSADPRVAEALSVALPDRLFLGGLRNLLCGFTAVAHHNTFHRSMARDDFPVRVLQKYEFAHSPGLTKHLRKTYRTTDRRIPWMVHAGEGVDEASRLELARLREENVLRQNTVVIHGIAFGETEARAMAEAKAALIWCPESNRRLYGATAQPRLYLEAGVRVGLGSDSPVSGVRDPLSNLAAARREAAIPDGTLLEMATRGTAESARLPLGGLAPGDAADLVAFTSEAALLDGDRRAIALVVVDGRPLYGEPGLMEVAGIPTLRLCVDGALRAIALPLGRRARALVRKHPSLRRVRWLSEVRFDDQDSTLGGNR
jgi:cytosine/adenosine deaminase-related metal-dependent hydrolase